MKKSKLLMLAVLLTACVALFCACNLFVDAKEIVIEAMPKTSYVTTDTDFDWTNFQLKVIYKSEGKEPKTYSYADLQAAGSFKVSKFDNSVGTHTATINYLGCSVSFAYTVADKLFAGGEGTAANPYQIATAEQFANIGVNANKTYFKLINDIDLTNYETVANDTYWWNEKENLYPDYNYSIGNVVIDGDGYALRNVESHISSYFYASTLKNVDIYVNIEEAVFTELGRRGDTAEVVIENVNIYGVYDTTEGVGQNNGLLASYVSTQNCKIKNVSVYADYLTYTNYGAIFVGYTNYRDGNLYFENAKFYGYAMGRSLGIFVGNLTGGGVTTERNIYISGDSGNYGTMVTTGETTAQAVLIAGIPVSNDQDPQKTAVNVYKDNVLMTKEENGSAYNKVANSAIRYKDATLKLEVAEDQFVLTGSNNTAVVKYQILAQLWTNSSDSNRTNEGATGTYTLLTKTVTVGNTGVYNLAWILDTERTTKEYEKTEDGYKFNDYLVTERYFYTNGATTKTYNAYTNNRKDSVIYTVFALDKDGKILGSFVYGLDK